MRFLLKTAEETRMYIDPGAGSLLLQVLAAGVISALATVSKVRATLKAFVRGLLRRNHQV